ncbi:hypothetical protein NPIL_577441, partial [Nephila pilipes]
LVGDRPRQDGQVLCTLRRHQRHSLYPGCKREKECTSILSTAVAS